MGGFANNGPIVTDGLVFYVDAGSSKSYTGSGTTWVDLIQADNGTFSATPTNLSFSGGHFDFDGVDDNCVFSGDVIPTNGQITISFWRRGFAAGQHSDISAFSTGTLREVNIHTPWENGFVYWQCGANGGSSYDQIQKNLSASEYKGWSHWTFTKNVSTRVMRIYLNGSLWHSGTGLTRSIAACNSMYIGSFGSSAYSNKNYACFSIYNKELSASEVLQNYNALKNRFIDPPSGIVESGLVFNLDAGNDLSYPNSGTTCYDLVDTEIGTLSGTTYSSTDGGVFVFDGTDDHILFSNQMVNPNSNFTFEGWVNASVLSGTIVSDKNQVGALQIRWSGSSIQLVDSYQVVVGTFTNFTASTDTWYNIAVVRSSNTYSLYVDGVYKSDFTSSNSYSRGPDTIGANRNLTEEFEGDISIIRFYSSALSASDILQNYNALKDRFA